MATQSSSSSPVGPDTLITIKLLVNGQSKKLKLPLAQLVPGTLPAKLRLFLGVAENQVTTFERFSDSSASYVQLDSANLHAYKTLYRAAKAKLKLRLRVNVGPNPALLETEPMINETLKDLANLTFGSETTIAPISSPWDQPPSKDAEVKPEEKKVNEQKTLSSIRDEDVKQVTAALDACNQQIAKQHAEAKRSYDEMQRTLRDSFQTSVNNLTISNEKPRTCPYTGPSTRSDGTPVVCPYATSTARKVGPPLVPQGATVSWSVYCNSCDKQMLDEHYHCNECEGGDYDLCSACLNSGVHCHVRDHWLIKRFMRHGEVVNSTTETAPPKVRRTPSGMPGAFTAFAKPEEEEEEKPTRTCNACVKIFDEDMFVTCKDCDDFDLCVPCLELGVHGHHPGHAFEAATEVTALSTRGRDLLKPGRGFQHAAVCDNCDKRIVGLRHKCLNCPDWDYCSNCLGNSHRTHPGHRFTTVYDTIPMPVQIQPVHFAVYCDGPLCKHKSSYITGIRYKCAVCADVDYCANCEAHPHLEHNRTHPLLKFRTPVRGCNITTMVDDNNQTVQKPRSSDSATTQVQTVAEVKPDTPKLKQPEKIAIKDLLAPAPAEQVEPKVETLEAHFVRDTISDGTTFSPSQSFTQTWTLKNAGNVAWPAGCSVHYVGGDNMFNIDDNKPSSGAIFSIATESNVIRRNVQPGEEIAFQIAMRAPKREGVAISYWRLKAPNGLPFGHRLWCHINVSGTPTSSRVSAKREVGRLGHHDAFLRHNLQLATTRPDMSNETLGYFNDALQRVKWAKLEALKRSLADLKTVHQGTAEVPAAEKSIEKTEEPKSEKLPEPEVKAANMVFPTLDKESPASSTHQDRPITNAAPSEQVPAVAAAESEADLFDDAESVSLGSEESDDGFLTEDEYDILDASDEETA